MKLTAICLVILAMIALSSAIRFHGSEPDESEEYEEDSIDRQSKWRPKIHVIKKRHGRVRHIHLYPMKPQRTYHDRERDQHTTSETHEHIDYNGKAQEAAAAESSKVEKMIDVDGNDNEGSNSHHYEHKQKIKVKHHHHHHHHNHVKTEIKKIPYPVEKIVQVEKVVEKVIAVPKPYPVKEFIEKKVPYPVEKIVEKIVHIPKPYPVIKHIPVEIKVPVPIEKPIPYPVEKKVPYPVKVLVPYEKKHHYAHHHHDSISYDHHGDYTNNKYQQVYQQNQQQQYHQQQLQQQHREQQQQHREQQREHQREQQQREQQQQQQSSVPSSEQSESSEYLPSPEHLRGEQQTQLFHPSQLPGHPYNQQHQLHHQQQYSQLRRDLLTREQYRTNSQESVSESSEFRPMMSSGSSESSSSNNVETVVPPPPNHHMRSPFQINVPNDNSSPEQIRPTSSGDSGPNGQFTHNIEIPVHFYRLSPLDSGEGFTIE